MPDDHRVLRGARLSTDAGAWPPPARRLLGLTRVVEGVGLHSGRAARAWIEPATRVEQGVLVRRVDCRPPRTLPGTLEQATPAPAHTCLGSAAAGVATVEHLLSALCGLGIWDARVCVAGPELPILDGSSVPWVAALREVCAPEPVPHHGPTWRVTRPWRDEIEGAVLRLTPAAVGRVCCVYTHAHPAIGAQCAAWSVGDSAGYLSAIAPARTFGFAADAEAMQRRGLARAAGLHCVLAFDDQGVLNPEGLRFPDEPVRHKLLDAIGDLGLLGGPTRGTVELTGSSHRHLLQSLRRAVAAGVLQPE